MDRKLEVKANETLGFVIVIKKNNALNNQNNYICISIKHGIWN